MPVAMLLAPDTNNWYFPEVLFIRSALFVTSLIDESGSRLSLSPSYHCSFNVSAVLVPMFTVFLFAFYRIAICFEVD